MENMKQTQAAVALNFSWQSTVPPGGKPETQGAAAAAAWEESFTKLSILLILQLLYEVLGRHDH